MKLMSIFTLAVSISATPISKQEQLPLRELINNFSTSFFLESSKLNAGKNLITSPISAHILLGLLSLGAQGETRKELQNELGLLDDEFTKSSFRDLMFKLQSVNGVVLKLANKIYLKDDEYHNLNKNFENDAVESFSSEVQKVDFVDSSLAANTINNWVQNKTNHKIKKLISSDSLSSRTSMVLVNAIYFKGNWDQEFDTNLTAKEEFHMSKNKSITVDMMHQNSTLLYTDIPEWNAKMVELPYEGFMTSMVIIVPNEVDGFEKLESQITGESIVKKLSRSYVAQVNLSLPKFKIESTIDLKKVLQNIGLKCIFMPYANLRGISKTNFVVSNGIQKSFIEVNEKGAEAAAASALAEDRIAGGPYLATVDANRPFFYAILYDTDTVLFSGRIVNPEILSI